MEGIIIVTNNSLVNEQLEKYYPVIYHFGTGIDALKKARNLIHQGYRLLTHPFTGSITPERAFFRTMALKKEKDKVNIDSLHIIEDCINKTESLLRDQHIFSVSKEDMEDLMLIDCDLIMNALKVGREIYYE